MIYSDQEWSTAKEGRLEVYSLILRSMIEDFNRIDLWTMSIFDPSKTLLSWRIYAFAETQPMIRFFQEDNAYLECPRSILWTCEIFKTKDASSKPQPRWAWTSYTSLIRHFWDVWWSSLLSQKLQWWGSLWYILPGKSLAEKKLYKEHESSSMRTPRIIPNIFRQVTANSSGLLNTLRLKSSYSITMHFTLPSALFLVGMASALPSQGSDIVSVKRSNASAVEKVHQAAAALSGTTVDNQSETSDCVGSLLCCGSLTTPLDHIVDPILEDLGINAAKIVGSVGLLCMLPWNRSSDGQQF